MTNRGRKKELTLKVNQQTGEITVAKDAGMDVVILNSQTGYTKVLNPRPMVVLEQHSDGSIVVKDSPPKTRIDVVKVSEVPKPDGGEQ